MALCTKELLPRAKEMSPRAKEMLPCAKEIGPYKGNGPVMDFNVQFKLPANEIAVGNHGAFLGAKTRPIRSAETAHNLLYIID